MKTIPIALGMRSLVAGAGRECRADAMRAKIPDISEVITEENKTTKH